MAMGSAKAVGLARGMANALATRYAKGFVFAPIIFVNQEYGGEKCDQCSGNHYESFRDETKLLCSPCHKVKHLQFTFTFH